MQALVMLRRHLSVAFSGGCVIIRLINGFSNLLKGGIGMDVAGLSMSMAAGKVQNQVSIAMLSKAMDTNEALGQGLVEMIDSAAMEQSVNPHIGANFDMRV